MKKGKRINGESQLPEAMIHHIQSFLSGKEAARTTLVSKSWYSAWLTRPALDFDERHFRDPYRQIFPFELMGFVAKTMERYAYSHLKIESFRLLMQSRRRDVELSIATRVFFKLIEVAMRMGATDLDLDLRSSTSVLPRLVLQSETLLRLSLKGWEIDGGVNCSMLKSLSLERVNFRNDDMIRDIVSCCVSIEELSLSNCGGSSQSRKLELSGRNVYKLHKLKILYLEMVDVDESFFEGFKSRFPCLKDLSLVRCHGYSGIPISSNSLQRISIVELKVLRVELKVPNLAYFSYSGAGILTIEARNGSGVVMSARDPLF